jgi:predicted hydrocarbon binding protein
LFQFTLRDVLEQNYGTEVTDDLFRSAGVMAGREFYKRYCSGASDLNSLSSILRQAFIDLGIGIFRVEKADPQKLEFTFNMDEDLDCSGMPDTSDVICVYDEGFIKGILEAFSGKKFKVKEVDCWCSGSRTCRFDAKVEK